MLRATLLALFCAAITSACALSHRANPDANGADHAEVVIGEGGADGMNALDVPDAMDRLDVGDVPDGSDGPDVPTCTGTNERMCGTACVDVSMDPANCGACGTACAAGEMCNAGTCTPAGCGCSWAGTASRKRGSGSSERSVSTARRWIPTATRRACLIDLDSRLRCGNSRHGWPRILRDRNARCWALAQWPRRAAVNVPRRAAGRGAGRRHPPCRMLPAHAQIPPT